MNLIDTLPRIKDVDIVYLKSHNYVVLITLSTGEEFAVKFFSSRDLAEQEIANYYKIKGCEIKHNTVNFTEVLDHGGISMDIFNGSIKGILSDMYRAVTERIPTIAEEQQQMLKKYPVSVLKEMSPAEQTSVTQIKILPSENSYP